MVYPFSIIVHPGIFKVSAHLKWMEALVKTDSILPQVFWCVRNTEYSRLLLLNHIKSQSSEHHFAHPLPVLEPWELGLPCWLFFLPTFQCWIVGPSHVPGKLQTMASKRCHKHTTHRQRGAMTSDTARLPLNFAQRMHCLAIHMCVTRPSHLVLPHFDLALCTSPVPWLVHENRPKTWAWLWKITMFNS